MTDEPGRDAEAETREAIIAMVTASLRRWEGLEVTRESLRRDPAHRAAFVRLLRECRPLPVIKALEADVLASRL